MNQENAYSKDCGVKYLLKSKTSADLVDFNRGNPNMVTLRSNIISQGFRWPVIMSLVHGISTVTKHGKWSCKSQKRTGHSQSRY